MVRSLLVLAAGALALGACDSASETATQRSVDAAGPMHTPPPPPPLPGQIVRFKAGTELPSLTLSDPSGAQLNTTDLKGTPVLLNLWATWCVPCVVEMPMLDDLGTELAGEVKVLTISQDIRGADVVAPFFEQRDFANLEQWLDPDAEMNEALNPEGLMPVTILFDADGKELFRVAGGYEWDSEEAIAAIKESLAPGGGE
ncbi:TlpA family protein disulfide reductase [Erythrobacter sp.]|nr:TlpA family protein disulfide reductase [Erythrobacter sp.]